jgi:adenylate cyclase
LRITKTAEYLIRGAPGARTAQELMEGTCASLVADGMPLARGEAFVRTLHPNIVGRSFVWHADAGVAIHEHTYAFLRSEAFLASPVAEVCRTNAIVRHRASNGFVPRGIIDDPRYADVTDYVAAPMRFLTGEVHAITLATRAPEGFTDAHVEELEAIVHPMARIGEIHALARTAVNLLDTYVGRNAGEKILSGRIHLGDTESIEAVVWFSDLRGFTRLAGESAPADLIRTLNELFECQVPAIEAHGGEVLKFIGDGILAMFPIHAGVTSVEACRNALAASRAATRALVDLNVARAEAGRAPLAFGLALHVGDVAYGNIGGASRLDFTCIGPAVNLAARLESLTSQLGVPVVTSAAFARAVDVPMHELGEHELKGVAERQLVFRPA